MHHAQLYVGDQDALLLVIDEQERTPGVDVHYTKCTRFGIKEARELKRMAFQRPVEKSHRNFIVLFNMITTEAQNALLKLLEEPPATARFYIIIPREDMLLPTLRSRLTHAGEATQSAGDEAKHFLRSSYRDRLEAVARRTKEKDDAWAERVLQGAELILNERHDHEELREVVFVRKYFYTSGASKKMLLEHLALTLSVVR
jgi:hypothetical protein